MHRLYGLRGKAYVKTMKRIMVEDGDKITARFNELARSYGKFTPRHLGLLATEFRLPLTVLDNYLPTLTEGRYPSGTWERLKDRGVSAIDIGVNWRGDRP